MANPAIAERVLRAAKVIKIKPEELREALKLLDIDPDDDAVIDVLDAIASTSRSQFQDDLTNALSGTINDVPFSKYLMLGVASVLLGLDAKPADKEKSFAQMSDEDLVAKYGVDCHADLAAELDRRSHRRPFVVFDGENVDYASTVQMLRVARRFETCGSHKLDDKIVMLNRVGEFPFLKLEICPIHRGTVLVDGYCEHCADTWKGVSMEDRQFVAVAKECDAVSDKHDDCQKIIGKCLAKELYKGWPALVHGTHESRKGNGSLPILVQQPSKTSRHGQNMIIARFF